MAFVTDIQQPQRSMEYHSDPVKPASDYGIPTALDTVGGFLKLAGSSQGTSKVDTSDYIPNVIQRIKAYKDVNNLTDEWFREEAWQASADYAAAKGADFSDVKKEYDAYFGASAPSVGDRAASEKGREEAAAEAAKIKEQGIQKMMGGMQGDEKTKREVAEEMLQSANVAAANIHAYNSLIATGNTEAAQKQLDMMCIEGADSLTRAFGVYLSALSEEERVKALRDPNFVYPIVSGIYAGNPQAAKVVSDMVLDTTARIYEDNLKLANGVLAQEKARLDNTMAIMKNTALLRLSKDLPLMILLDPNSITADDLERVRNLIPALRKEGIEPESLTQNVNAYLPLSKDDYKTLFKLSYGSGATLEGRNIGNSVIANSSTGVNRIQAWDNNSIAPEKVMATGTPEDKAVNARQNANIYSKAVLGTLEESGEYSEYSDKLVITTTDGKMHVFDLEGNEVLDHPLSKFFAKNEGKVQRFQEAKQFDTLTAARDIAKIVPPSAAVEAFGRINGIDFTQPMTPEEYKSFIKSDRFKALGKIGELRRKTIEVQHFNGMPVFKWASKAKELLESGVDLYKEVGEGVAEPLVTLTEKYYEAIEGPKPTISTKLPEQTVSTSVSPLEIEEGLTEKVRKGEKLTDEDLKKVEEAKETLRNNKDYKVIDDAIELVHKVEAGQKLSKEEKKRLEEAKEEVKKILKELNNE